MSQTISLYALFHKRAHTSTTILGVEYPNWQRQAGPGYPRERAERIFEVRLRNTARYELRVVGRTKVHSGVQLY